MGAKVSETKSHRHPKEQALYYAKVGVVVLLTALGAGMVALMMYAINRDVESRNDFFNASAEIFRVKFVDTFTDLVSSIHAIGAVAQLGLDDGRIVPVLDDLASPFVDTSEAIKRFNLMKIISNDTLAEEELKLAIHVNSTYPQFSTPAGEPLTLYPVRDSQGNFREREEYYGVVWYRYPAVQKVFGRDTEGTTGWSRRDDSSMRCLKPFAAQATQIGTPTLSCYMRIKDIVGQEWLATGALHVNNILKSLGVVNGVELAIFDSTDDDDVIFLSAVKGMDDEVVDVEISSPFDPTLLGTIHAQYDIEMFERNYTLYVIADNGYLAWSGVVYRVALGVLVILFIALLGGFVLAARVYVLFHKLVEDNIEKEYVALLGTMTHALRNPIHALIYYTETLKDGYRVVEHSESKDAVDEDDVSNDGSSQTQSVLVRVNDEFIHTLQTMWATTGHVHDICNSFMDYQQLTVTELNLRERPCDLLDTIQEVVTQYRVFNENRVQVTLEVNPEISHIYRDTDGLRFRQIIGNGLSNSCKLTKSGSVTTIVDVVRGSETAIHTPENENDWFVVIKVKDTGIGIPEEVVGKLFVQYERGAKPMNVGDRAASSGLGLVISRQLARLMHGEVLLENRSDGVVGAEFTVILPVPNSCRSNGPQSDDSISIDSSTKADLPVGTALAGSATTVDRASSPKLRKKSKAGLEHSKRQQRENERILAAVNVCFAEDDYTNNTIFKRMLKKGGVQNVVSYLDGSEVLRHCKECVEKQSKLPDIIFLDIVMETMGGEETLLELKKLGIEVPIVAVTGNALVDDVERYCNLGFCDVVTKPFTIEHIRVCILRNASKVTTGRTEQLPSHVEVKVE